MPGPMRQEMLQLQEQLQAMMQELEVEAIIDLVAITAEATADSLTDRQKKGRMLWYARHFRKLAQGPPASVGHEPIPRKSAKQLVTDAFVNLLLRTSRIRQLAMIPPDDLEWMERLGTKLEHVATEMEM